MDDQVQTRVSRGDKLSQSSDLTRKVSPSALMKYAEASALLDVSPNHLRNMIDAGFLVPVSVGIRGKRLRRKDVDTIVRDGIVQAKRKT